MSDETEEGAMSEDVVPRLSFSRSSCCSLAVDTLATAHSNGSRPYADARVLEMLGIHTPGTRTVILEREFTSRPVDRGLGQGPGRSLNRLQLDRLN
jgi:hypothetical protein